MTPLGGGGFSPERCGAYFRECADHLHDIPIEPFLLACDEIKSIVGAFAKEHASRGKEKKPAFGDRVLPARFSRPARPLPGPRSRSSPQAPSGQR
jgi:hypothetical protein